MKRTTGKRQWNPEISGVALRKLREGAGLQKRDVAWKLGVNVRTVNAWEDGEEPPQRFMAQLDKLYGGPDAWTRRTGERSTCRLIARLSASRSVRRGEPRWPSRSPPSATLTCPCGSATADRATRHDRSQAHNAERAGCRERGAQLQTGGFSFGQHGDSTCWRRRRPEAAPMSATRLRMVSLKKLQKELAAERAAEQRVPLSPAVYAAFACPDCTADVVIPRVIRLHDPMCVHMRRR